MVATTSDNSVTCSGEICMPTLLMAAAISSVVMA